ncbi:MAG: purine-nucleoside phosphorylase [Pseudomonadota bacterium]
MTKGLNALTKTFGKQVPDVAVVLGSGLGAFAERLEASKKLPYQRVPGFPKPKVPGHAGEVVVGKLGTKRVLIFRGRFHYYEGHSLYITVLPIRLAGAWGIKNLIVTNAAGGVNPSFPPGSLMLIRDHLNLIGANPPRGPNLDSFGTRFPDMTNAYDPEFRALAKKTADRMGFRIFEGVYAAGPGPSYETPAEISMLRTLGADATGMSTVPEVIVARQQGMRVLGVSCVTNHAAGVSTQPITHDEVIENSKKVERDFCELLERWIAAY